MSDLLCQWCRQPISEQQAWTARSRGYEPKFDTPKCRMAAARQRYRQKLKEKA